MKPLVTRSGEWPLSENQLRLWADFAEDLKTGKRKLVDVSCPCGGTQNPTLVADRDRYNLPLSTYACDNCGLLYTTPRLADTDLQSFYKNDYRELYQDAPVPPERFFKRQGRAGQKAYARLDPYLPQQEAPLTVIDVGCGAGGSLVPFLKKGHCVTGVDFDEDYLAFGRARGLNLLRADGASGSTAALDGSADIILAIHVLEHCADPVGELRRWTAWLKPRGILYVEVPGIYDAYRVYKRFLRYLHIAHLYHFSLGTLSDLVAKATGLGLVHGDESIYAIFRSGVNNAEARRVVSFIKSREGLAGRALTALQRRRARTGNSLKKRFRGGSKGNEPDS